MWDIRFDVHVEGTVNLLVTVRLIRAHALHLRFDFLSWMPDYVELFPLMCSWFV